MKSLILGVTFALACSSCAAKNVSTKSCPNAKLEFAGSVLNERGRRVAVFSIKNEGRRPIKLPLEGKSLDLIHGRYVATEQRSSNGGAWQAFNPLLDEMLAPSKSLEVAPGQQKSLKSDVNGLLLGGQQEMGMEYSIVLKDEAGCSFRSIPFSP